MVAETQTIDPHVVGIDATEYYNLGAGAPHVVRIRHVYVYDAAVATCCCELTPSFDLRYAYTYIEYADHVYADEALRDRLDADYAYEAVDDCYVHCRDVAKLAPESLGVETCEADEYEEALESIIDHEQGNPTYC